MTDLSNTRVPMIWAVTIVTTFFMLFFIGIRLYSRSLIKKSLGLDDWFMVGAVITALGFHANAIIATIYGSGYHLDDIDPTWAAPFAKVSLADFAIFPVTTTLTKVSLCVTYLRIFPSRRNRILCYGMIGFVTALGITCVFLYIFACVPIEANWDPSTAETATCLDTQAVFTSTAAIITASDIVIFLYPIRAFWNVQLPGRERIALIAMFSAGLIVAVFGVLRFYFLVVFFKSEDTTYDAGTSWVMQVFEVNLGIMCGCLQGVRPTLRRFFPGKFGGSSGPSYGHSNNVGPHGQSFPFQSLSGRDWANKSGTQTQVTHNDGEDSPTPQANGSNRFALADHGRPQESGVKNGITVSHSVTVDRGASPAHASKPSDNESEEWIMRDRF